MECNVANGCFMSNNIADDGRSPRHWSALSIWMHWLIVLLILVQLVDHDWMQAGLVAWFGGVGQAAEVHGLMWNPLLALIGLHVIGALAQQFWFKSDVLKRIIGAA